MARSLPVLLIVVFAQLTQLGAGLAAALSVPDECTCRADEAEPGVAVGEHD